jgi:hypothetical protein
VLLPTAEDIATMVAQAEPIEEQQQQQHQQQQQRPAGTPVKRGREEAEDEVEGDDGQSKARKTLEHDDNDAK